MEKEELFKDEFLKQFKTGEKLNVFINSSKSESLKRGWKGNLIFIKAMIRTKSPKTQMPVTDILKR